MWPLQSQQPYAGLRAAVLAAAMLLAVLHNSVAQVPLSISIDSNGGCDANCTMCASDLVTCLACTGLMAISNGSCVPCADPNCANCTGAGPTTCRACQPGYSLGGSADAVCTACEQPSNVCADCSSDPAKCDVCAYNHGFDAQGRCVECTDPNCSECFKDHTKCSACFSGYGHNLEGGCSPCPDPDGAGSCYACSGGVCTQCVAGFGLADGGEAGCKPCVDSECFDCSLDYQQCQECYAYAGPGPNGKCTPCKHDNCVSCSETSTKCSACYEGEGLLLPSGKCAECKVEGCKNCSANASACEACDTFAELVVAKAELVAAAEDEGQAWDLLVCRDCALKEVCSDLSRMNPYSGPPLVYVSPECAAGSEEEEDGQGAVGGALDLLAQPMDLSPNGTICGVCGPLATTPLSVDDLFFEAASAVLAHYLDKARQGEAGPDATLCPGRVSINETTLTEALGYCGTVFQKSGFSNSTVDVRFAATADCSGAGGAMTVPGGVVVMVDGMPGGPPLALALRGIYNKQVNTVVGSNTTAQVLLVQELTVS